MNVLLASLRTQLSKLAFGHLKKHEAVQLQHMLFKQNPVAAASSTQIKHRQLPVASTLPGGTLQLVAFTVSDFGPSLAVVWSSKVHDPHFPVTLLAYELVDLVVEVS